MAHDKDAGSGRMSGGFLALPWVVLDSAAYQRLSHPARSLLLEFGRQLGRNNNGQLLASGRYLRARCWKSNDTITRAKRELLEAGFIYETVIGYRPNKASWYAVTWHALAQSSKYDPGTWEAFQMGAFLNAEPLPKPKPTRQELYRKWPMQHASPTPPDGVEVGPVAPLDGVGMHRQTVQCGAVPPSPPTPPDGDHLVFCPVNT